MRKSLSITVVAIGMALATTALAKPKQLKAPARKPSVVVPDLCKATGQSTKVCYVEGQTAEIHVNISRDYPILVMLDELPNFAYDDPYIQHQVTQEYVIFKLLRDKLPKGHNLILVSDSMTITLYFHEVKKGGDSQVHIQRADRAGQDQQVEARVAARVAELEAEHKKLLRDLDIRAERMAQKQFLDSVHNYGSHIGKPAGEVHARGDFVVLRATDVVRIGKQRLLLVSVEERKGDVFTIGDFSASVTQKGVKRSVDVQYRCARTRVRPGSVVRCTLSLGSIDKRKGRAIVKLRLAGADGERAVSLDAVNIL